MRRFNLIVLFLCLIAAAPLAQAASGKVVKVLPQFLDLDGRNAISPSLYDRDAYQAVLRRDASKRSAQAFFIQWKAHGVDWKKTRLRVEMRGVHGNTIHNQTIEQAAVKHGWFSTWTTLKLDGPAYKEFGDVIAWKVTLWEGDKQLGEQKSFLW